MDILKNEELLALHIKKCKTCSKNYAEDYCIIGKAYASSVVSAR